MGHVYNLLWYIIMCAGKYCLHLHIYVKCGHHLCGLHKVKLILQMHINRHVNMHCKVWCAKGGSPNTLIYTNESTISLWIQASMHEDLSCSVRCAWNVVALFIPICLPTVSHSLIHIWQWDSALVTLAVSVFAIVKWPILTRVCPIIRQLLATWDGGSMGASLHMPELVFW